MSYSSPKRKFRRIYLLIPQVFINPPPAPPRRVQRGNVPPRRLTESVLISLVGRMPKEEKFPLADGSPVAGSQAISGDRQLQLFSAVSIEATDATFNTSSGDDNEQLRLKQGTPAPPAPFRPSRLNSRLDCSDA